MIEKSKKVVQREVIRRLFELALDELNCGLESLREDQAIGEIRAAKERFVVSRRLLERGLKELDREELVNHFSNKLKFKKSELDVLRTIRALQRDTNEPVSISDVLNKSESSRSSIYGAIKSCTKRGYLIRHSQNPCPTHGHLYLFTPDGEHVIEAIQQIDRKDVARYPHWN